MFDLLLISSVRSLEVEPFYHSKLLRFTFNSVTLCVHCLHIGVLWLAEVILHASLVLSLVHFLVRISSCFLTFQAFFLACIKELVLF